MGDEAGLSTFTDSNMCFSGEVKTAFATAEDIDSMKAMLAGARPDQVLDVADGWMAVHDHLVSGGGSIKSDFDKAVDHVLQHWEGESADEFAKEAKKVSKSITDCSTYASRMSTVMRNVGQQLSDIKPKVEAIEKPGTISSAMNSLGDGFSRDDSKWRGEIQGNQGAQKALDSHHDDLSAGKEEQLKAAALMETLALTYTSQAQTMGSWSRKAPPRNGPGDGDYPGDPGGVAPVPIAVTPDGGGTGAAVPGASRTGSGAVKSASKATSPAAGTPAAATKVDGVSGGTATTPRPGGANSGTPSGGGVPGGGASAGAGGGVPGGPGYVGQASGNRGGVAGGKGVGASRGVGGRVPAGLGAGAGAGGAGGAGGKGIGAAAGRGPLARQRGGTLDTPQQGQGAARQGGQGLHSSRGGSMAGERGRGPNGLMGGGVAGNNARRNQDENSQGERPDYLVEDEETWMPKRRDVAPPTIG
ncbi:hypothetical protein AN219_14535 [Streptomyces nanshensis]|nr:hypothetical protein AN219_14535 [Streptomyces nanshensis]